MESTKIPSQTAPLATEIPSVLILDDVEFERIRLERLFKKLDFECNLVLAGSVIEYLNALNRHRYDMVFLDYYLVDGDGLNALRFLRAHPLNYQAAAFLISQTAEPEVQEAAIDAGFEAFISKETLTPDRLKDIVRKSGVTMPEVPAHKLAANDLLPVPKSLAIPVDSKDAIGVKDMTLDTIFSELTFNARKMSSTKLDHGQFFKEDVQALRDSCADFVARFDTVFQSAGGTKDGRA